MHFRRIGTRKEISKDNTSKYFYKFCSIKFEFEINL